ncbi:unnamed protein product, partial [Discosporangium mesarthrocarpum]
MPVVPLCWCLFELQLFPFFVFVCRTESILPCLQRKRKKGTVDEGSILLSFLSGNWPIGMNLGGKLGLMPRAWKIRHQFNVQCCSVQHCRKEKRKKKKRQRKRKKESFFIIQYGTVILFAATLRRLITPQSRSQGVCSSKAHPSPYCS